MTDDQVERAARTAVDTSRAAMFDAIRDCFLALAELTKVGRAALVAELTAKQQQPQGERRRPTTRYPEDGPRT